MTNQCLIGVLDSGVGGLSILKELKKRLPNADYIYMGDTANLPYGSKTKEQILFFNRNILNFFIQKGVTDVVIACNTTSALTYDELKKEFEPKGLRIFPLIQSVAHAALKGLNDSDCLCVLSTAATAKSGKYASEINKINPSINVVEIACPGFVEIVENRLYNSKEAHLLIEEKMKIVLKNNAKRVILGCTHYPYLKEMLSRFAPADIFFNPACALAQNVKTALNDIDGGAKTDFYVTKNPQEFKKSAKLFFEIKEDVKCVKMPEFSLI